MKRFIKDNEKVYTTGAYLRWDAKDHSFRLYSLDDDTFADGELIGFDEMGLPYIESGE
jgi:hypothetical protein